MKRTVLVPLAVVALAACTQPAPIRPILPPLSPAPTVTPICTATGARNHGTWSVDIRYAGRYGQWYPTLNLTNDFITRRAGESYTVSSSELPWSVVWENPVDKVGYVVVDVTVWPIPPC